MSAPRAPGWLPGERSQPLTGAVEVERLRAERLIALAPAPRGRRERLRRVLALGQGRAQLGAEGLLVAPFVRGTQSVDRVADAPVLHRVPDDVPEGVRLFCRQPKGVPARLRVEVVLSS